MSFVDEVAAGGVNPGDFASQLSAALTAQAAAESATAITQSQAAIAARAHGYLATATAATPNATHAVNGSAQTLAPDATYAAIGYIAEIDLDYETLGVETVTTTITATFNDSTTESVTDTKALAGVNTLTNPALLKSGLVITGLSIVCKSTIDSSTATVTATVKGLEVK